jgi:hypothetical protein
MGIPLCTLQANSNTQYVDLQFSGRLGRPQIEASPGRGFQVSTESQMHVRRALARELVGLTQ